MTEEHRTLPAAEALLRNAGLLIRRLLPDDSGGMAYEIDAFLALPVADVGDEGQWTTREYEATGGSYLDVALVVIAPDGTEYGPMFPGTAKGLVARLNARSAPASDAGLREASEELMRCLEMVLTNSKVLDPGIKDRSINALYSYYDVTRPTALDAQKGETGI